MRCVKFFLSVLYFYAAVVLAASPADKLTVILADLHTMQANFVQTILNKKGSPLQQSSGKMAIQRPGKFHWETRSPSHQLLVADGKNIWFYDKDLAQVTVQAQAHTEDNSPAMLLSGSLHTLTEKFVVTTQPAAQGEWFLLVSKNKSHFFQSVKLRFVGHTLQEMYLIDNLGQSSRIVFKGVENNPALPVSFFRFSPPKGVDVIQQ